MAGTFTGTLLAQIQLPSTIGTLLTAPTGVTIIPSEGIIIQNTTSSDQTVDLYVKVGATETKIYHGTLVANGGRDTVRGKVILAATNLIRGTSTNASVVDCTISGVVET